MAATSGVIVIAASAGGHQALIPILATLPRDFPMPVLIVQHLTPTKPSYLATMLARHTVLPVTEVNGAQCVEGGHVYTAPPDHHLIVRRRDVVSISGAAKMHFTRPAADLLFTSAALHWGAAAVSIVLSGYGSDGAVGTQFIKDAGGTCIAQDPASALAPYMPAAAIKSGAVDLVLPPLAIAHALIRFAMVPGAGGWLRSTGATGSSCAPRSSTAPRRTALGVFALP